MKSLNEYLIETKQQNELLERLINGKGDAS